MAAKRRPRQSGARSRPEPSSKGKQTPAPTPGGKQEAAPSPAKQSVSAPASSKTPDENRKGENEKSAGLDAARHAAAQQTAHRAEAIRQAFIPGCMATALGTNGLFDASAFRCYLDQFLRDAGDPHDPVERALVEQIAFAHLRLGDLHSQAAGAKSVDSIKVFTSATARLLGETRRLALSLRDYRAKTPTTQKIRLARVG